MSQWLPTPPVTPVNLRTLTAPARLMAAGVSAREAVNALLRLRQATPSQIGQKNPRSFTQTKTKMKYKKPAKSKLSSLVRKEIAKVSLRQTEIKNSPIGTPATLLHNQIQGFGITQRLIQGTDIASRVGDEVFLQAFRAQIIFAAPTTAGAYAYRVMVVWSGEEYASTTFTTSILTASEVFLPSIHAGSRVAGVPNTKAVTVLYDEQFEINSNIASTADVYTNKIYVNLRNQKFAYQASGSVYGKTKNLYLIVVPNVQGGTLDTTSCGGCVINSSLDFRDP